MAQLDVGPALICDLSIQYNTLWFDQSDPDSYAVHMHMHN